MIKYLAEENNEKWSWCLLFSWKKKLIKESDSLKHKLWYVRQSFSDI